MENQQRQKLNGPKAIWAEADFLKKIIDTKQNVVLIGSNDGGGHRTIMPPNTKTAGQS
jgi:hypothetical protein